MLTGRDGYGCPTCGPDVYCRDDAGDYEPADFWADAEPADLDDRPALVVPVRYDEVPF